MNIITCFPDGFEELPDVKPFALMRDDVLPALKRNRLALEAMYDPKMGRPEIDPVFLAGFTILQMMQRMPDRAAVSACEYDVRWRLGLGLPSEWPAIHPTSLVRFRSRLAEHGGGKLALEAGLEAMRRSGYLKGRRAVRIDSTHVLGHVADMSRLECVRETLRLALSFLAAFGGPEAWEPWFTRYADRNPQELRGASFQRLRSTMDQAGSDAHQVIERVMALGPAVAEAEPISLLQRVFDEQYEINQNDNAVQRRATPANAVHNPHDSEAAWSTKTTLGKAGWVGYKLQVCETASEGPRASGEPTEAVITAIVTQPATASDNGSLNTVLATHTDNGEPVPDTVFADAGYINAPALIQAQSEGYELCGPIGAPPHSGKRFGSDSFDVDIPNRRATCPVGKCSSACSCITETARSITYYYFAWSRTDCTVCPLAHQCLSKKKVGTFRTLQVGEHHMQVQARRSLCRTSEYKSRMHRRSGIEGSHSELKRGYGITRCRYRSRSRTDVQMQFTAAACNLSRWAARLCWVAHNNK